MVYSQRQENPRERNQWTGTNEEKIWGLMTVWAETKFAFPHTERLQELNWDNKVQEFIPRVIESESMESYYKLLMELVALLKDSHTFIVPPWGRMTPGYDIPPGEIQVIDDKFYIARIGQTDELKSQQIHTGLEILEIENILTRNFFNENVLKYYTRGPKQADEATLVFYLLYGPKGERVRLKVRDTDGAIRNVEITRNSGGKDGPPFMYRFMQSIFTPTITQE